MRRNLTRAASFLALAVAAALVLPSAGDAQIPEEPQEADPPDREELVQFTEAYVEVAEIQAEVQQAMAQAESAEEANQIQQEASVEIQAALQEHRLTEERYSDIIALLNVDPELREEFEALYEEIVEGIL